MESPCECGIGPLSSISHELTYLFKPTENTSIRPRRRWEENVGIDFKEIGVNTRNWIVRLRIGIIGEPLLIRNWIYGFHNPLII